MDDQADSPNLARLRLIAALLGIPLDSFFGVPPTKDRLTEVIECLRLWDKITTDDGRSRALAYLRTLADEQTG